MDHKDQNIDRNWYFIQTAIGSLESSEACRQIAQWNFKGTNFELDLIEPKGFQFESLLPEELIDWDPSPGVSKF